METNNSEREGAPAIVRKYRQLVRTLKQTRVEQIIISGILQVIAILRQLICQFSSYVWKRKFDLWGYFVGRADTFMGDGLHLCGRGAAVFVDEHPAVVDSGMGSINDIFASKHCLTRSSG